MADVKLNIVVDGASGAVKSLESVAGGARKAGVGMDELDRARKRVTDGLIQGFGQFLGARLLETTTKLIGEMTLGSVRSLAALGSELTDLSDATGLSLRSLQQWKFAGSLAGVEAKEIADAVNRMQKALFAGVSTFDRLGLSVEDLRTLEPDKAFERVAAAIAALPSPTQQAAAAMEIFGRTGARLLPVLKLDLAQTASEAERLGIVMSDQTLRAADELDDQVAILSQTWEGLKRSIGEQVLPDVTEAVRSLTNFIAENREEIIRWVNGGIEVAIIALEKLGDLARGVASLGGGISDAIPADLLASFNKTHGGRAAGLVPGPIETITVSAPRVGGFVSDEELRRQEAAAKSLAKADLERALIIQDAVVRSLDLEMAKRLEIEQVAVETASREAEIGTRGRAVEMVTELSIRFAAFGQAATSALNPIPGLLFGVERQTGPVVQRSVDWSEALADVANQFQALGPFGSVLSSLAGGIASIGAQLDRIRSLGGLGKLLSGQAGIGGFFAGMSGALAIGGAAVGIGKAVFGFLTSSPAERAAKAAGRTLGLAVSDELAETIAKTSKSMGISFDAASLLHLNEAMHQGGKTAHEMHSQVLALMRGVAAGTIPAKQGLDAVNEAFSRVRAEAAEAGTVGDALTVIMLKEAQATGQLTDDMRAYLAELDKLAAAGTEQIGSGFGKVDFTRVSAQFGENAAFAFAGGFQEAIEEQGILAALDTLGEQVLAARDELSAAGHEAAAAMLDPFARMQEVIGGDEHLRGMLEIVGGMGKVFEASANRGDLTAESIGRMGSSLAETQAALEAGGLASKDAMQAILPELSKVISAAQQYGFALDPATEALKQQAEAMGFAFPKEPMLQVVDLLTVIARQLGADIPAQAAATSSSVEDLGLSFDQAAASSSSAAQASATAWQSSASTTLGATQAIVGPVQSTFDEMAIFGAERGEFVSQTWNAQVGEIALFVNDLIPQVEASFIALETTATGPIINIKAAMDKLGGSVAGVTAEVLGLGVALDGLPSGGGVGAPPASGLGLPEKTAQGGLHTGPLAHDTRFVLSAHRGETIHVDHPGKQPGGGGGGDVTFNVSLSAPAGMPPSDADRFGREAARAFISAVRGNQHGLRTELRDAVSERRGG